MSGAQKGRSLELFFIDGRPDGMLTAEVFNWTGHVLLVPRTQIAKALQRKEVSYAGVYLLLGEQGGQPFGYVGEAENLGNRIRQHESGKDWWDQVVIITSNANQLNKAHVKYLEARLIQEAVAVGRLILENASKPQPAGLSESATANMEIFLEHVLLILPALRIDSFLRRTRTISERGDEETEHFKSTVFELKVPKYSIHAEAKLVEGEFVVLKGSCARKQWHASEKYGYGTLHAELISMGVLAPKGDLCEFTENYAFRSPSAAAAVVTGRTANGRREWRVKGEGNTTYAEWEEKQLAAANLEGR